MPSAWSSHFFAELIDCFAQIDRYIPGSKSRVVEALIGTLPDADPAEVYLLADSWGTLAQQVNEFYLDMQHAADPIFDAWSGDGSALSFQQTWSDYLDGVGSVIQGVSSMQQAVQNYGLELETEEIILAVTLLLFLAQAIAAIIGAFFTGGVALGLGALSFGATRFAMKAAAEKALEAILVMGRGLMTREFEKIMEQLVAKEAAKRAIGEATLRAATAASRDVLRGGAKRAAGGATKYAVKGVAKRTAERGTRQFVKEMVEDGLRRRLLDQLARVGGEKAGTAVATTLDDATRGLTQRVAAELEEQLVAKFARTALGQATERGLAGAAGERVTLDAVTRAAVEKFLAERVAESTLGREAGRYVGENVIRGALGGVKFMGGIDAAAQGIELVTGERDGIDLHEVASSMAQGAVIGGFMHGNSIVTMTATGAAGGAVSAGATDLYRKLSLEWQEAHTTDPRTLAALKAEEAEIDWGGDLADGARDGVMMGVGTHGWAAISRPGGELAGAFKQDLSVGAQTGRMFRSWENVRGFVQDQRLTPDERRIGPEPEVLPVQRPADQQWSADPAGRGTHTPARLVEVASVPVEGPAVHAPDAVVAALDRHLSELVGTQPGSHLPWTGPARPGEHLPDRIVAEPDGSAVTVTYPDGVSTRVTFQITETLPEGRLLVAVPEHIQIDDTWQRGDAVIALPAHAPEGAAALHESVGNHLRSALDTLHRELHEQPAPPADLGHPDTRPSLDRPDDGQQPHQAEIDHALDTQRPDHHAGAGDGPDGGAPHDGSAGTGHHERWASAATSGDSGATRLEHGERLFHRLLERLFPEGLHHADPETVRHHAREIAEQVLRAPRAESDRAEPVRLLREYVEHELTTIRADSDGGLHPDIHDGRIADKADELRNRDPIPELLDPGGIHPVPAGDVVAEHLPFHRTFADLSTAEGAVRPYGDGRPLVRITETGGRRWSTLEFRPVDLRRLENGLGNPDARQLVHRAAKELATREHDRAVDELHRWYTHEQQRGPGDARLPLADTELTRIGGMSAAVLLPTAAAKSLPARLWLL